MNIFIQMCPSALLVAAPIIIAALGGLFSERSGVVNIAIEGIMVMGAFSAAASCYFLEQIPSVSAYAGYISLGIAVIVGTIYSILLGVSAINLKADQTIAGTAVNMLATGLSVYLCQILFAKQRTESFRTGLSRIKEVPFFSEIPMLGDMMFKNIYPTIFIALILVVLVWYVAFKTPFGLRLRSCGENPHASASAGIDVYKMRWIGVLLSGALAGLAGACMVLTSGIQFTAASIHGVGFISIAALIFGKWNPWGVLGAGLFFGFSTALGTYASFIPLISNIPSEFFIAFPYILTVVALVVFSGKSAAPKAEGQIYDAGKR